MKIQLLACVLLGVMESSLFANAGYFSGSGHTIELSKSDQIQMVSEEVKITPRAGFTMELDEVEYRCCFVLKNVSPTATAIQVGFPLDGESAEDSLDADKSSAHDVDESDRVMSYRFIARDKDNTYHVRYLRQDRHAKFRRLFVWDMAFAPQEEKTLHVAYVLPLSAGIASTVKREEGLSEDARPPYGRPWFAALEPCVVQYLAYVTETGNSWKGPIEIATFHVDSDVFKLCMEQRQYQFHAPVDPPPGSSEPQQLYAMKVGLVYLEQSPGDWRTDVDYGPATWIIHNYKPGAPIHVVWYGTSLPSDASECESVVRQLMGPLPVEAEVLELAEIVAAFYGIAPKTDSVKEFVERQVWYHPKSGLERSAMTDQQREILTQLEMIAKGGLNATEAGQDSRSLTLSFTGPFADEERINPQPITTSWLKIAYIGFRSSSSYEHLDIEYHAAKPELNSNRLIHYFITVTDVQGRVHTVVDKTRVAPGPRTDIIAGSVAGQDDSFPLPIPPSSIRKLDMRFTPEGPQ